MTPPELLAQFAIRSFEPPLSDLRESGAIADLSSPVSVLVLLVDFDTEVAMNGIANFIGNSTGRYADETAAALDQVGCPAEAETLRRILKVASGAGMTHAAVQEDLSRQEEFAVVSFSQVHGEKWEDALDQIDTIAEELDFDSIHRAMEAFTEQHQEAIAAAIAPSR